MAFWSDAAILSHLGQHVPAQRLLDEMLHMPAKGLTNIAFPLEVAATELARVPARDARVVLLSDCVHNAGPDPRPLAARLPRLDVLLDTSGEQDEELARTRGRSRPGCRGWTSCSTPRASRTSSWPGTWPGWATGGCGASGPTPMWHPR